MSASLSLTIKETEINTLTNTSKVTVTLKITAKGSTYNSKSRSGYIIIDNTKYAFKSAFGKSKTTTLATKSKTITHSSNGSKSIVVKGQYSTGTSVGVLNTSKTITLTKINRTFLVSYNLNGGVGDFKTQTKKYGSTLYLWSGEPTRVGYDFLYWKAGNNIYYPESAYSTEASLSLTAVWSEKTYSLTYYDNSTPLVTDLISYSTAYSIRSSNTISKIGYTLLKWKDPSGITFNLGQQIKKANEFDSSTYPCDHALYAEWERHTSNIKFNANGGIGNLPSPITILYDDEFIFPENNLVKEGYEFLGWSINSLAGSIYTPGKSIIWKTDLKDVTIYAIWKIITIPVHFYRLNSSYNNFIDIDSYNNFYTDDSTIRYNNYVIPYNIKANDIKNYTFSGYWTLEEPNQKQYTSFDIKFPIGVIPYNYIPTEEDNFLKPGSKISYLTSDVYLYPVYRDNTPSTISNITSSYEYVASSEVSLNDYFLYVSEQKTKFSSVVNSNNIVAYSKFRNSSENNGVPLDYSEIKVILTSTDRTIVPLEPVEIKSNYNVSLDTTDYYVLIKNEADLIDKTKVYNLIISNLKDGFGKSIPNVLLEIYPPKLIRDINKDGNVIALFTDAPDNIENLNVLLLDGELLIDNSELLTKLRNKYSNYETLLTNGIPNIGKILIRLLN